MAFGNKKKDQDEEAAALAGMPPPEAEDDLTEAFAPPEDAAAEPAPSEPASVEAAAPAADPFANPDALLNMFQESQTEGDDRSVLLDLAGEVRIEDLLEDLNTLVAAMGIRTAAAA